MKIFCAKKSHMPECFVLLIIPADNSPGLRGFLCGESRQFVVYCYGMRGHNARPRKKEQKSEEILYSGTRYLGEQEIISTLFHFVTSYIETQVSSQK